MHKLTQWWLIAGLLAVAPAVFAQQTPAPAAPAPARQAPPPEDLEPGVNTSAMPSNTEPPGPAPAAAPVSGSAAGSKSSAGSDTPAAGGASQPTTPKAGRASATSKSAKSSAAAAPATAATGSNSGGAKGGKSDNRVQLDTTQITGNQELPKVLYIVPWKRSDLGDMLGKPANSLLDEVLQPVDRDVFKRENRYYDALKPDAGGASGKAAGAAAPASGDKR